MPTPQTVTVSYSRKVQLEQFEPIEQRAELTVMLDDNDDEDDVYDDYSDVVEDMVERSLASRIAREKVNQEDEDE